MATKPPTKPAAKKAAKPAPKKTETEAAKNARALRDKKRREAAKAPAKKTAVVSDKAIGEREKRNGVTHPAPGTIGSELWAIADACRETSLKGPDKREPARFEYRQAVADSGKTYDVNSISFNWFSWRKFHGIEGRATNLFPKRGTFEVSDGKKNKLKVGEPAPAKVPPAPTVPKPAAKTVKTAKKAAGKPVKASAPKAAKKTPAPAPKPDTAKPAAKPVVSSRLAKASAEAAAPVAPKTDA